MVEPNHRQYLEDVDREIQDLIYDRKAAQAIPLLSSSQGISKTQAMMELGMTLKRMQQEFPDAFEDVVTEGSPMTGRSRFLFRFLVIIFLLVGSGMTYFGVRGLIFSFASRDWPTAEGAITESRVERVRSTHEGKTKTTYHARVSYHYTVNGQRYTGDRVAYGDAGRGNSSVPNAIVRRYPAGSKQPVYYKPDAPEECLLEPGFHGTALIVPGIGSVFLVISSLFAKHLFFGGGGNGSESASDSSGDDLSNDDDLQGDSYDPNQYPDHSGADFDRYNDSSTDDDIDAY